MLASEEVYILSVSPSDGCGRGCGKVTITKKLLVTNCIEIVEIEERRLSRNICVIGNHL